MYKILTSIATERTYNFFDANNILPSEQRGCKKESYGWKDQLLINKMLLDNSQSCHRNLSVAWIGYIKAFDSVLHIRILRVFQMYEISPTIINFLTTSMKEWKTNLCLNYSQGNTVSENIKIKCGIIQDDSLSPPPLFCLALVTLSYELNNTGYGYSVYKEKINHLFYMDDLKLYGKNDYELDGLLKTVKTFGDDIGMTFGKDKCVKDTFVWGKMKYISSTVLDRGTKIKELDQEEAYKYLGIEEGDGIQHGKMKEKIRQECYRRV